MRFLSQVKQVKIMNTQILSSFISFKERRKSLLLFVLGIWNEAGQRLIRVLPRECTGYSKHPLPTTQEMTVHMDITRWST